MNQGKKYLPHNLSLKDIQIAEKCMYQLGAIRVRAVRNEIFSTQY
jgi:hypothetical protein